LALPFEAGSVEAPYSLMFKNGIGCPRWLVSIDFTTKQKLC